MHPILATRRRLGLYLLAWLPVAALLSIVAWTSGAEALLPAAAEMIPACAIMAFLCLSPWYVCRARPLRLAAAASLVGTFVPAAAVASLLLVASARLTAMLLERPGPQLAPLFGMGVLLYLVSVALHYAVLAVEASRQSERREAAAQTLAREAELQALRMQLNPHFLFNSLHSISALAGADGARAREMCLRLSEFLRSSLRLGSRESVPLREELALARNYLDVERVRFGSRLQVAEQVDEDCLDCDIPPLLLQPLVENAVKHGVAALVEGGTIRLAAHRVPGGVAIRIENPVDPDSGSSLSLGLGLQHVRRRLEVRYGSTAGFEVGAAAGTYSADLRLPCESPIASSSRA
jgi:two-component system, LytTR family, sensor histidine kinase AlgZ